MVERIKELRNNLGQVTRRLSTPVSDLLLSPQKLSQEAREYRSPKIAMTIACLFGAMEGLVIGGSIFQGDPLGMVAIKAISSWEGLNILSLACRDSLIRDVRMKRTFDAIDETFEAMQREIQELTTKVRFPTINLN